MKYLEMAIVGILFVGGLLFNNFTGDTNTLNKGVYYDNVKYTDNVVFNNVDGLNLDYQAKLTTPGDFYELEFDVVNSTKHDIEIADHIYNESDEYITYELSYADGKKIKNGDIIKAGESKKLKYKVSYINLIKEENYTFDTTFAIQYEQAI